MCCAHIFGGSYMYVEHVLYIYTHKYVVYVYNYPHIILYIHYLYTHITKHEKTVFLGYSQVHNKKYFYVFSSLSVINTDFNSKQL